MVLEEKQAAVAIDSTNQNDVKSLGQSLDFCPRRKGLNYRRRTLKRITVCWSTQLIHVDEAVLPLKTSSSSSSCVNGLSKVKLRPNCESIGRARSQNSIIELRMNPIELEFRALIPVPIQSRSKIGKSASRYASVI